MDTVTKDPMVLGPAESKPGTWPLAGPPRYQITQEGAYYHMGRSGVKYLQTAGVCFNIKIFHQYWNYNYKDRFNSKTTFVKL